MSETSFPINDLLRRKAQTGLTVTSLTVSVASTLFLLLFSEKMGLGISSMTENRLTLSFSTIFSNFLIFIGILIFAVGIVIISFMVFVMMSQKVKDIGLMKAAGCPNDLVFGYFLTELLVIAIVGCFLGVILGITADFVSTGFFSNLGFQIPQKNTNFWFVLLVFGLFFMLSLVFGAKPILDTTKIEPKKALSPSYYFGLSKDSGFKAISKSGLTIKIALRSLFRHKSATIRVILCLSTVFILATVGVAGGIIANQTTKSWIEKAIGTDTVLIAHTDMVNQYSQLLSSFYEATLYTQFDYANESYLITEKILNKTSSIANISGLEQRLVLETHVKELQGYIINSESGDYTEIGDSREGNSLVIGIEPSKTLSEWYPEGNSLRENGIREAVLGDSLAQKMFDTPTKQRIYILSQDFNITGVCMDPMNNGNVTYVSLKNLQNATGLSGANVIIARLSTSTNREYAISQLREEIQSINPDFGVLDLNSILDKTLGFVGYVWSTIMFLPLFSLFAASLCLLAYFTLTVAEERQEFGVLRVLGAKPRVAVEIVLIQSLVVLLSSCAVGVAFGVMITLLILVPEPLVTSFTIVEIAGWLMAALAVIFTLSLYPAIKSAKKPILEAITQT